MSKALLTVLLVAFNYHSDKQVGYFAGKNDWLPNKYLGIRKRTSAEVSSGC